MPYKNNDDNEENFTRVIVPNKRKGSFVKNKTFGLFVYELIEIEFVPVN